MTPKLPQCLDQPKHWLTNLCLHLSIRYIVRSLMDTLLSYPCLSFPNCCHKDGNTELSGMPLYFEHYNFSNMFQHGNAPVLKFLEKLQMKTWCVKEWKWKSLRGQNITLTTNPLNYIWHELDWLVCTSRPLANISA